MPACTKTILFIAYEFPPLNFGGVHRPLAFAKYLNEFDIKPIIVTLSSNSYHQVYRPPVDHTLGKDVLTENIIIKIDSENIIRINKSRIKNFFDIFFSVSGNESKGWRKDFKLQVTNTVKEFKPEAVFVTVPPFSILKEAAWVAKKFNLPLITDFRDAWSQWRVSPYGSYFHYKATLRAEAKYLQISKAIIATSKQTLADFKKLHPSLNNNKFHIITNGFDDEITNWAIDLQKKNCYTIGYVGSFYYSPELTSLMFTPWWKKGFHRKFQYIPQKQAWLYRSPYFFFKALRKLFDENPEYARRLKVKFAGQKYGWIDQMIKEFKLDDTVELIGVLSHRNSLLFQQSCDALLITSSKVIGGKDYSIAGKTFEYFKMQKPIIAFVCEGAQKDILEESGMALICDPDDEKVSAILMKQLFDLKIYLQPNNNFLSSLSRKKLTEKLASIIKNTINS